MTYFERWGAFHKYQAHRGRSNLIRFCLGMCLVADGVGRGACSWLFIFGCLLGGFGLYFACICRRVSSSSSSVFCTTLLFAEPVGTWGGFIFCFGWLPWFVMGCLVLGWAFSFDLCCVAGVNCHWSWCVAEVSSFPSTSQLDLFIYLEWCCVDFFVLGAIFASLRRHIVSFSSGFFVLFASA